MIIKSSEITGKMCNSITVIVELFMITITSVKVLQKRLGIMFKKVVFVALSGFLMHWLCYFLFPSTDKICILFLMLPIGFPFKFGIAAPNHSPAG